MEVGGLLACPDGGLEDGGAVTPDGHHDGDYWMMVDFDGDDDTNCDDDDYDNDDDDDDDDDNDYDDYNDEDDDYNAFSSSQRTSNRVGTRGSR